MEIEELQETCFKMAKEKGFFDPPLQDTAYHMLAVGELSEAVEELREDRPPIYQDGEYYPSTKLLPGHDHWSDERKPKGELIELADCIMRILSYCGHKGYNMEEAILLKLKYNKTRPYKHGKQF